VTADEKQMWERFHRDRDDKTRTWLIEHYTPLVRRVAARFRNVRAADRDDLVGYGALGLVRAVDAWDPARMDWEKFASLRVKFACIDGIRGMTWVPKGVRSESERLDAAEEELASELGRTPSTEELAARLGIDPEQLEETLSSVRATDWNMVSLDWRAETEAPWSETVADDNALLPEGEALRAERREMLSSLLARLPERERFVIEQSYFSGRRDVDIAEELGVHPSRVSQLESAALAKLKVLARQQPLKLEGSCA